MMQNIEIPLKYECENSIHTIMVTVSPGSIAGVHALAEDQERIHTRDCRRYKGNTKDKEQQTEGKKGEGLAKNEDQDMGEEDRSG